MSIERHLAPRLAPSGPPDIVSGTVTHLDLVVGSDGIASKDQIVLRSLLRVMDGQNGLRLKFSDELSDCNVVLVPPHWPTTLPPSCVSVCVVSEDASADATPSLALLIRAPLRLTNTGTMLRAAAKLLDHRPTASAAPNGLGTLLETLLHQIRLKEKHTIVLPFSNGSDMVVNFADERYYSPLPIEQLLEGNYQLSQPRRAGTAEITTLGDQQDQCLRKLVWLATHRRSAANDSGVALSGYFRLLRWPDSVALSHPRFPRLAALLTSRPQTIEQASAISGASVTEINYFLKTNLALGIAEAVEMIEPPKVIPKVSVIHSNPAPSMLGRLRDRLKLW